MTFDLTQLTASCELFQTSKNKRKTAAKKQRQKSTPNEMKWNEIVEIMGIVKEITVLWTKKAKAAKNQKHYHFLYFGKGRLSSVIVFTL